MKVSLQFSVRFLVALTASAWVALSLFAFESARADVTAPAATESRWSVEGYLQSQSVAGNASPLFGPALTYRLCEHERVGFRFLSSISQATDEAAYTFELLLRHEYSQKPTHLFTEANLSYDIVKTVGFASGGASIGVIHLLTSDFAIGGTAGFEAATKSVKSYGVGLQDSNSTLFVYPKIAVFGAFSL